MSHVGETFFTVVGCMDGRIQEALAKFGREKIGTRYPDTITEAGMVGIIAKTPYDDFIDNLRFKLSVSLDKHNSKGIIVAGHEDCARNPVSAQEHKKDIKESIEIIKEITQDKVPVVGVYVVRGETGWRAHEI